jgi:hypothetical protein
MSAKLMTIYTLIIFTTWHNYLTGMEVVMNSLILTSLFISESIEKQWFIIFFAASFMLLCALMVFNKGITLNKNNPFKGLV